MVTAIRFTVWLPLSREMCYGTRVEGMPTIHYLWAEQLQAHRGIRLEGPLHIEIIDNLFDQTLMVSGPASPPEDGYMTFRALVSLVNTGWDYS